jgi:ubiquitin carboxyl-terminal hydrolase 25/28
MNGTGGVDFDSIEYLGSGRLEQEFTIDGRSNREEEQWWNPEERKKNQRPGPGMFAPILAEELHDSDHSLFSVHITGMPPPSAPQKDSAGAGILATPSTFETPPSESEVRTSVPHPNAYYCPKDNGWVILSWKSSSIPPPLARSYVDGSNLPLPDPMRRRRTSSCIEEAGQPFGKANRTHHFHRYEGAVDSHKLIPPLRKDEWKNLKQKRRTFTVVSGDTPINPDTVATDEAGEPATEEEEGKVLDLYVCCQCTLYCVASEVISGVVSRKYMDELQRDRKGHPAIGKSPEQTIALTVETIST